MKRHSSGEGAKRTLSVVTRESRSRTHSRPWVSVLVLAGFLGGTQTLYPSERVPLARSGAATISRDDPKGPVSVAIRTRVVGGASPCVPPGGQSQEEASVIGAIAIAVGKEQLSVPASVFADLQDPLDADLNRKDGLNVLSIRGGDGSEGYIVRIYFDSHAIRRRTLSSLMMPDEPTQDTRYWLRVLRDE